jgi:hypothetical protein
MSQAARFGEDLVQIGPTGAESRQRRSVDDADALQVVVATNGVQYRGLGSRMQHSAMRYNPGSS